MKDGIWVVIRQNSGLLGGFTAWFCLGGFDFDVFSDLILISA